MRPLPASVTATFKKEGDEVRSGIDAE